MEKGESNQQIANKISVIEKKMQHLDTLKINQMVAKLLKDELLSKKRGATRKINRNKFIKKI